MAKKADLKKLQREWYKKLEDDGFKDIEQDEYGLKHWSSHWNTRHSIEEIQSKISYYEMADKFLSTHKFDSEVERAIWEYHSNGIGSRDIVITLAKVGIRQNRTYICRIIKRLETLMKNQYLPGFQ